MADHLRFTYRKCELNPKNIAQAKAEEEARKANDGNKMEYKIANVVEDDGDKMIL